MENIRNMSTTGNKQQGYECSECKNNYSTAYSMYRHKRKVHNLDINKCVTLYCPIENCNQSYDRYNALDTHLTRVHYADIRKETLVFSDLTDFEAWLRSITSSSKTKYIKRSCNNSYRYYRCHRSGLPKTSTDKINSMKSSVKIGRHCPSRIIAKITDRNVQVEFVPTHIGHECEIAKSPLSEKKRLDIARRLATTNNSTAPASTPLVTSGDASQQQQQQVPQASLQSPLTSNRQHPQHNQDQHLQGQQSSAQHSTTANNGVTINPHATTSGIIHNDSSLMITLAPMKTAGINDNQQLALATNIQSQQGHMIQAQLAPQSQLQSTTNTTTNITLLPPLNPSRQELTSRFEQLVASIRTDKHACIVKAQLEVCFAFIRD